MARPANQQAAASVSHALLVRRLPGSRRGSVRAHLQRAERIAESIWRRWQVGPPSMAGQAPALVFNSPDQRAHSRDALSILAYRPRAGLCAG